VLRVRSGLWLAAPLMLIVQGGAGPPSSAPDEIATVRVETVDGLGGKVTDAKIVSFKNQKNGHDLAKSFHVDRFLDSTASGVPYGRYDLRVQAPGFPEADRIVDVLGPEVSVEVCVRTATVHLVSAVDLDQAFTGLRVNSFKSREDNLDLAGQFRGGTASKIPYGVYDLWADHPLGSAHRRVDVFQQEVWVIVGLEVYGELPEHRAPGRTISGRIENITAGDEPLYVRLVGIYVGFSIDDKVRVAGSSGTFTLAGLNPFAKFFLITVGRRGILDVRQLDTSQTNPIVVDLGSKRANR